MRLNLRPIIHVPGGSLPFQFELDLSALDFFDRLQYAPPMDGAGC